WNKSEFDDSAWKKGKSGFGTEGTPGAVIGTKWATADIWLRREIELGADELKDAELYVHHDDNCEIYMNGLLAGRMRDFTSDYVEQRLREEARKGLKPGKIVLAVHCHQTGGGQYIDVGLVRLVETKGK